MTTKLIPVAALVLAASAVAACQSAGDQTASDTMTGPCRADAAAQLVGMERLSDQQAMQMTGATLVRQIAPGQGVTMDYRPERVTIETDPATGRVTRAACG